MGRTLIGIGLLLVLAGAIWMLFEKLPGGLRPGSLPGDIQIEKGNFRFYFPLATSILISIVLTLIVWLISRRS